MVASTCNILERIITADAAGNSWVAISLTSTSWMKHPTQTPWLCLFCCCCCCCCCFFLFLCYETRPCCTSLSTIKSQSNRTPESDKHTEHTRSLRVYLGSFNRNRKASRNIMAPSFEKVHAHQPDTRHKGALCHRTRTSCVDT